MKNTSVFILIITAILMFSCNEDEEWLFSLDYFDDSNVVTIPELYFAQNFENLECTEDLPDEGSSCVVEGIYYLNGPDQYNEEADFFFLHDFSIADSAMEIWVDYSEIKDEINAKLAAIINANPLLARSVIVEGEIYNVNFIPPTGPGNCGKMIGIHAQKIGISGFK